MLKYDEWVVPGEVEYAERKAAEIEAQIEKYYETVSEMTGSYLDFFITIQITEHIFGEFKISLWEYMLSPPDIDVYNYMLLDWFRDQVAPIDAPKVFDLPEDDIRNKLPEWEESLLPDNLRREIIVRHSVRHMVDDVVKYPVGDWQMNMIKRKFYLNDAKYGRIMETFGRKLDNKNKSVVFTELEEKIADYIKDYNEVPWYFPLAMTEEDIMDAIREAYLNACKRSRRRMPDKYDYACIGNLYDERIENYECLYQGKGGDMIIRFLFDFKNMKIVTAYPVLKEEIRTHYDENYYDRKYKCFFG